MFKVNLEKEIIKQNQSLIDAKELLLVKEYDRLGDDVTNSDVLKRVFGTLPAVQGKRIKNEMADEVDATKKFDQSRVFHISQIEKLCHRYHLRFLRSQLFNGTIDAELPGKISAFEIAYDINIQAGYGWQTFICAPASSFKLAERSKDPLLFYKINDNYFYLIHKWGRDLNIIRRAYSLFSNSFVCWLTVISVIVSGAIFFGNHLTSDPRGGVKLDIMAALLMLFMLAGIIFSLASLISGGNICRFVKENNWRSEIRD